VRFYGLLDHDLDEVIEFYLTGDAAERELAEILADEPGWVEKLEIVLVDFAGAEPTVARLMH
jgi:hypothetical protein